MCRLDFGSVCKRLYAVVRESSSLWHDVSFEHADFFTPEAVPTYSAQRVAFVQHRISAVRDVVIGPCLVRPQLCARLLNAVETYAKHLGQMSAPLQVAATCVPSKLSVSPVRARWHLIWHHSWQCWLVRQRCRACAYLHQPPRTHSVIAACYTSSRLWSSSQ